MASRRALSLLPIKVQNSVCKAKRDLIHAEDDTESTSTASVSVIAFTNPHLHVLCRIYTADLAVLRFTLLVSCRMTVPKRCITKGNQNREDEYNKTYGYWCT